MPAQLNWVSSQWFPPNLTSISCPVKFGWAWNTGQIGCKFNEITFVCLPVHSMATWSNLVVIISMDLHPIRLVEFDRALNTGQIGCKFTEITLYACLVKLDIISVDLHPIWPVFHARLNLTGHEILVKMGVNSLRLHLYACLYIVWLPGQIWWS